MRNALYNSFYAAALLVCNFSLGDSPEFRYFLNKTVVLAGDRATLEVRLDLPQLSEDAPIPEVADDLLTQNESFVLLQKDVNREQNTMVWRYALTSYLPQTLSIPPIQIRFGPNTYSTERMALVVASDRNENDEALREGFGNLNMPIDWKKIFFWACGIGLILACVQPAARLIRRLKIYTRLKHRLKAYSLPTKADHLAWLKDQLSILKVKVASEEERDTYVDELTLILKTYFSKLHEKPIFTMTSQEFAYAFSADPSLRKIHQLFRKCDQFKFAKRKDLESKTLTLLGIEEAEQTLCSP